jgi:glycosyltransferase involved in cell wall biosynthesis
LAQVAQLRRRGINASLVVLKRGHEKEGEAELCRIRSWFDLPGIIRLSRRMRRADIVLTHLWFANTMGRIGAVLTRHRGVFAFEHNMATPFFKTRNMLFFDMLLERFSHTIAVSKGVREGLIARGLEPSRITVIENGIDLTAYTQAQSLTLPYPHPTFLYVGRLARLKGLDVLLAAFRKVEQGVLLVAGEGGEGETLRKEAGERVIFLGARTDVPALLKSCDCLVVPSRAEGMPMILLEGMAAGVPIITTDFSSLLPEVRSYAKVVPVDDPEALARAMHDIPPAGSVSLERFSIVREIDEVLALYNARMR